MCRPRFCQPKKRQDERCCAVLYIHNVIGKRREKKKEGPFWLFGGVSPILQLLFFFAQKRWMGMIKKKALPFPLWSTFLFLFCIAVVVVVIMQLFQVVSARVIMGA